MKKIFHSPNVFINIERIIHIAIILISMILGFSTLCKVYPYFNFDTQTLLLWDYTAQKHLLPFRDFFYPYGLLYYFRNHDLFFSFLYIAVLPVLLISLYYFIKRIWNNAWLSIFSFLCFFLFILTVTGVDTFSRYGVLVVLGCFFAKTLFSYKEALSKKTLFFVGIFLGLLLPLFIDQILYAVLLFFSLFFIDKLLRKTTLYYFQNLRELGIFISGLYIGSIPFVLYLLITHSFTPFIHFLLYLPQISLLAKTPFIHSLRSIQNIFTLLMLLLTLLILLYKTGIQKRKCDYTNYLQIALVLSLCILEQKNIIRSIDTSISFVGFLLFFMLASQSFSFFKNYYRSKTVNYFYIGAIFLILFFLSYPTKTTFSLPSFTSDSCMQITIESFLNNNTEYEQVLRELQKLPQREIFSYPGDPLFYVFLNQRPPFYPSIYEASSRLAQEQQINYMKYYDLTYVIYNMKNTSIQDGVPNLLRAPLLTSYVLTHFTFMKRVNDFLILKKSNEDIFKNYQFTKLPRLMTTLTNIDLQNIPRAEGYYKKYNVGISGSTHLLTTSSQKELTDFLSQHEIHSAQLFMTTSTERKSDTTKISIKTKDGLSSEIHFRSCMQSYPCIIHLARLPIFYKDRVINDMHLDEQKKITISLYQIKNENNFW